MVEDEETVRETVVELLSDLGYRVLKARDAQSALAIIESGVPIDLLLTDVVMPGMSGAELAERFHALRPEAGVLYASGYADEAVMRLGIRDGVPFLQKPFEPDELVRRVRELMDN